MWKVHQISSVARATTFGLLKHFERATAVLDPQIKQILAINALIIETLCAFKTSQIRLRTLTGELYQQINMNASVNVSFPCPCLMNAWPPGQRIHIP